MVGRQVEQLIALKHLLWPCCNVAPSLLVELLQKEILSREPEADGVGAIQLSSQPLRERDKNFQPQCSPYDLTCWQYWLRDSTCRYSAVCITSITFSSFTSTSSLTILESTKASPSAVLELLLTMVMGKVSCWSGLLLNRAKKNLLLTARIGLETGWRPPSWSIRMASSKVKPSSRKSARDSGRRPSISSPHSVLNLSERWICF